MNAPLTTDDIQAYLLSTGWMQTGNLREVATIWRKDIGRNISELLLPHKSAADFHQRYSEVLANLQLTEGISLDEISKRILYSSHDFLSIRVAHHDVSDGTIPIDDGIELAKNARELLVSAGRAALQKRRSFRGHPPHQVEKLIENTRLGQTSHGSFIINVFCRIESPKNDQDIDFSSAVPVVLLTSLTSIYELLKKDILSPALEEAVSQGASSNMCDAIVKLFGQKQQRDITISFRPSIKDRILPLQPFDISFLSNSSEKLQLASSYLRESYNLKNIEIFGYVKRLDRELTDQAGVVWIHTTLPTGQEKNIRLQLKSDDYQAAIQAHRSKSVVRCTGDISVKTRSAEMINPHNFAVVVQGTLLDN